MVLLIAQGTIPPSPCPCCETENDGWTYTGDEPGVTGPSGGDATVCVYCGALLFYDDELRLRLPTDAQLVAVAGRRDLLRAVAVSARFRELRRNDADGS